MPQCTVFTNELAADGHNILYLWVGLYDYAPKAVISQLAIRLLKQRNQWAPTDSSQILVRRERRQA